MITLPVSCTFMIQFVQYCVEELEVQRCRSFKGSVHSDSRKAVLCYVHDCNYFGLVQHDLGKVCVLRPRIRHLQFFFVNFLYSGYYPVLSTIISTFWFYDIPKGS